MEARRPGPVRFRRILFAHLHGWKEIVEVVRNELDLDLPANRPRKVEARIRQRDVRPRNVDRVRGPIVIGVELAGNGDAVAAWSNGQVDVPFEIGGRLEIAGHLDGTGDHAVITEVFMKEHPGQLRDVEVPEPAV